MTDTPGINSTDDDKSDHIIRMINHIRILKQVNLFLITLDALDKDVFKTVEKILSLL